MVKVISVIIGCAVIFFVMQRMGGNKKQAAENIELGKAFLAANLEK